MWWYHLLGLLWTSQFLIACQHTAIAGAAASVYFTREHSCCKSHVGQSIWRVMRYHVGSMAFGSLIVTLLKVIRGVISYIQRKLKSKRNSLVRFLLCCMSCCFWCLEKFMIFINKQAYVEISIFGYSFCTAARKAFKILLKNVLLVMSINSVGAFCLFVAKLCVVLGAGLLGLYLLRRQEELHYSNIVLLTICVFSYFIASTFISVYKMVIDTLVICFCEDKARHNGKDKPYFMSSRLKRCLTIEQENNSSAAPERAPLVSAL
eukprot:m.96105 g.96105  ORF g.96105 m.96105 type:complete len:263 (+) comp18466_c0_seq5:307-1095(+)